MRKFALFLILSSAAYAAIPAGTQWDVRTTGNDANGGGYDPTVSVPGTDYSQQNSPQYTFTDLVIGGTTTQFTSVLNPVVAGMVGNVINITGGTGCTTGRFVMLSQSGGTATMDRALGTAASVCAAKLGGSLLTVDLVTKNPAVFTQGNTLNIKAGTYTQTGTWIIDTSAISGNLKIIGYGTTHADGGTKPLITTATNSVKLIQLFGGQGIYAFSNLSFSNTAAIRADGLWFVTTSNPGPQFVDCIFDGFVVALNGDNGAGGAGGFNLSGVEIKNSTSDGIRSWFQAFVFGSYVHNNAGNGLLMSAASTAVIDRSIFAANTGSGYKGSGGSPLIASNSVFASNGVDGITAASGATAQTMILTNLIIYGNTTYGIESAVNGLNNTIFTLNRNLAFGANGTANRSWTAANGNIFNDITLTANPFTNSGSGNYSLNATAGGGAACAQTGTPGVFPGGLSTGYLDVGAVQTSGGTPTSSQHAAVCIQ